VTAVPRSRRYPRQPITPRPRRITQLGPAEVRLLDDWGKALRDAFPDALGVYLVGSSMVRPDYRDIDVRIMLHDETFAHLQAGMAVRRLNLMLTLWGRQVTGLNIDCQVQQRTFANEHYPPPNHPRNPLGLRGSEGIEGA
jgi:hypothetical protein